VVRVFLALGLVANGILFGAGIWRSVLRGEQAFHTFAEAGIMSGYLGGLWIWPLSLLLLCLLLVFLSRQMRRSASLDV